MPTVLRIDGLRVAVYPNDHRPAHAHVIGGGGEAVFILNCPAGPVSLRESFGFTGQVLRSIEAALNKALPDLCRAWETIHGAE
jgi:Domain of unknown function (DUF4160)